MIAENRERNHQLVEDNFEHYEKRNAWTEYLLGAIDKTMQGQGVPIEAACVWVINEIDDHLKEVERWLEQQGGAALPEAKKIELANRVAAIRTRRNQLFERLSAKNDSLQWYVDVGRNDRILKADKTLKGRLRRLLWVGMPSYRELAGVRGVKYSPIEMGFFTYEEWEKMQKIGS